MRGGLTPPGVAARLKSDRALKQARALRKEPTKSEWLLWRVLRALPTHRFRRQVPFGPFIVDFACHRSKTIIEVDGGIHRAPDVALRDAERQAWLEGRGYRVLRVSAAAVEADAMRAARALLNLAPE